MPAARQSSNQKSQIKNQKRVLRWVVRSRGTWRAAHLLLTFSGVCPMLQRILVILVVLGVAIGAAGVYAEGTAKSGPATGEKVPGPFHPLNVTGASAGQKACLYCANGPAPVAVVFAREVNPQVTALLKKLDEATAKNSSANMGSFAVFCSDKDGLVDQLKKVAADQKLTKLVLSID